MKYPILLPPLYRNGKLHKDDEIELSEEEAAPLIAIGVLGKVSPTGEKPSARKKPADDDDIKGAPP